MDVTHHKTFIRYDAFCLLVLFVALLPFNGALLLGRLPFDADNTLYTIPFFSLFRERPFPLWNPYQFCGMPLIGNLQYQMFYPPRLLFLFADSTSVYGIYCFMHWLVASWGMYALTRIYGFTRPACVFAAITFSCGSFIQGRISNPILFASCTWFPGVLASAVLFARTPGPRTAALLAIVFSMLGFTGSPHGVFFGAVTVTGWLVWDGVAASRTRLEVYRIVTYAALAGVLFLMIFSPTWWHALELLPRTIRAQASFAEITADPLLPREILRLWTGGISTPEYLDKVSYAGMLPLLLVLGVIFQGKQSLLDLLRGPAGFGLLLCLFGVFAALGASGGIYHVIYQIPGFRFLIGPARALILFNLGWTIIGGAAFHVLQVNRVPWQRRSSVGFVLVVLFSSVSALVFWVRNDNDLLRTLLHPRHVVPQLAALSMGSTWVAITGIAVLLCRIKPVEKWTWWMISAVQLINLFHFNSRVIIRYEESDYFATPETVEFLRKQSHGEPWRVLSWEPSRLYMMDVNDARGPAHMMPKLPDYYRVREAQGYDPMMLRGYVEFITRLAGRSPIDDPMRTAHVDNPSTLFTNLSGVRYIIGYPWERSLSRAPGREIPLPSVPIRAVGITSLSDNSHGAADGTVVGTLELEGSTGTQQIMVKAGETTADVRASNDSLPIRHRPIEQNMHWRGYDQRLQQEIWYSNYYSQIPVPTGVYETLRVKSASQFVFHVANVTAVTTPSIEQAGWFREIFRNGTISVHENTRSFPRAYLVGNTIKASSLGESCELLEANESRLNTLAVVMNSPDSLSSMETTGSVMVKGWSCDSMEMEVKHSGAGHLVFTESYYPGWRAWVNGEEVPVIRTNGIFQGVKLNGKGISTVRFAYRPHSLWITLGLMCFGYFAAGVLLPRWFRLAKGID